MQGKARYRAGQPAREQVVNAGVAHTAPAGCRRGRADARSRDGPDRHASRLRSAGSAPGPARGRRTRPADHPDRGRDPPRGARARASRSPSPRSTAPGPTTPWSRSTRPADGAAGRRRAGRSLPGERLTGLGARHGLDFDQRGRCVALGVRPPLHRPRLPAGDARGRAASRRATTRPSPGSLSSHGWAAWLETDGAGRRVRPHRRRASRSRSAPPPGRSGSTSSSTPPPPRGCARSSPRPASPPVLPEWAYGHWKSRDVYEHQDDVEDDWRGYRDNDLPLDAIVIDSPWETQYNTWRFNPHQFPDAPGMVREMREDGVRTVVWVTPWVNLESVDGQKPPDPESERLHREPAPNYEEGARDGPLRPRRRRRAPRRPLVDGDRLGRRLHLRGRLATGGASWPGPCSSSASRASRPTTARATTSRPTPGSPTGAPAPRRPGPTAASTARRPRTRSTPSTAPAAGVVFGRSGWTGQQATGMLWGGDQASDFWSLRALLASLLTVGGERLLEPLPRRRRLPRPAARRALRARAARPLGAARRPLPADAGARPLPAGGLDLRRRGPRPLPRGGAAARAPRPLHPRRRRDRRPHRACP